MPMLVLSVIILHVDFSGLSAIVIKNIVTIIISILLTHGKYKPMVPALDSKCKLATFPSLR